MAELDPTRTVFSITGSDRVTFLENLVTNAVRSGLVYAALLSPQGKYQADFFLLVEEERILLDVDRLLARPLFAKLSMYRLRADVQIEETEISVVRGPGDPPDGAFADPRHAALGWRAYGGESVLTSPQIDWDALRVAHVIPQTGIELIPDDTYILEAGFQRLNGVDFRKGCYVGQEVTARMKHKTNLRKGLVQVALNGDAEVGTEITLEGRPVGTVYTSTGGKALAFLRFDRAGPGMTAGGAAVIWSG